MLGEVLIGGLVVAAAVFVGVASIVTDSLTESEKRKQQELNKQYERLKKANAERIAQIQAHTTDRNVQLEHAYYEEQKRIRQAETEKMKVDTYEYIGSILKQLDKRYKNREKFLAEVNTVLSASKKAFKGQQKTYIRANSIRTTLISFQEAKYKIEAYLHYLDSYRLRMLKTKEKIEDKPYNYILNVYNSLIPFSMLLPTNYPYEGRLYSFSKEEFEKNEYGYSYKIPDDTIYMFLNVDKSDIETMKDNFNSTKIPFMAQLNKNNKRFYLSRSKGIVKSSIGATLGFDAEVEKVLSSNIILHFPENEYLKFSLSRTDMLNSMRNTPIGSTLRVFVKEYEFALNSFTKVSEKAEDGMTIADFNDIAMKISSEQRHDLFEYLKSEDLLEADAEWRIGPILNGEILTGVKLQIGNYYAIEAKFTEYKDILVLEYVRMLPKYEMLSFDDIFVTTKFQIFPKIDSEFDSISEENTHFTMNCSSLQLYLTKEFVSQRKIMANSPMSNYLNQWTEITTRIIDKKSYGRHFNLYLNEDYSIDDSSEILKFINKLDYEPLFFMPLENEEGKIDKKNCKIDASKEKPVLKFFHYRPLGGQVIDLYECQNTYVEEQQLSALSKFKDGQTASDSLKEAIVDIEHFTYVDNGHRIKKFLNKQIEKNTVQKEIIERAFSSEHFFIIQGPPGTGKTTVIKELIFQQLAMNPKSRILVVSQANVAVDNVLRGIINMNIADESKIVRCGTEGKIAQDVLKYSFENQMEFYKKELKTDIPKNEKVARLRQIWLDFLSNKKNSDFVNMCFLDGFQIIGATCVGLVNRRYSLSGIDFDLVVIDEAGKALPGELLIPITKAKKLILIGDHKQLPPVIDPILYGKTGISYDDVVETDVREDFLNRSFFQRLYEDADDNIKGMLNIQFRMPPVIGELVNMFYDGNLITSETCNEKKPLFCDSNIIFIDMKNDKDYYEQQKHFKYRNGSPFNLEEVKVVKKVISKIRKKYLGRIVVITPYLKQKFEIQNELKKTQFENIDVNTIDAFQGDEEDVVIYCTTRSKQPTKYFSDSARLNVAFSRSKNTLIFIGSSDYLKKYDKEHIIHKVCNYLENNAKAMVYPKIGF